MKVNWDGLIGVINGATDEGFSICTSVVGDDEDTLVSIERFGLSIDWCSLPCDEAGGSGIVGIIALDAICDKRETGSGEKASAAYNSV